MAEAPLPEEVLQVDQLLRELVEIPVALGISVHRGPRGLDGRVGDIRQAEVAIERGGRDRDAAAREQPDRLVIDRRRRELRLQRRGQVRPVPMRVDHRALLVAEHELDQPELIRLKARRPPERTAKGRVVARREGREHVPGLDELRHDPPDSRQHLEGRLEIIGADRSRAAPSS